MSSIAAMLNLPHLIALAAFTLPVPAASSSSSNEQFVYSGFTGADLTMDGSAAITPTGLLELTNGTYQLKGHALYPTPFRFRRRRSPNGTTTTVRSFSVSFAFGIVSAYADVSGQGIAFLIAPRADFSAAALPSQYMGLVSDRDNGNASNNILAVELDTVQNNEFGDIDSNHVGININGLVSVNSSSAGYYDGGEFRNLTLMSSEVMRVWIDYHGDAERLDVALAPVGMAKPARPLVSSSTLHLSRVLTDMSFVGFSSATGMVNTRHYILGWSFAMDAPAPPIDIARLPRLPLARPKKDYSRILLEITLPVATAAFLLAASLVAFIAVQRHARYAEVREDWEDEFGPHRFSYKDLFCATEGFKDKHLLGIGGFGRVYKGLLPGPAIEIAVKRVSHDSKQGVKEFIAEVVSVGRLQHRNLARLLGYCRRKGELLLVYEYMPNGSLDRYLFGCDGDHSSTLSWDRRFQIIKGIASGLHYLHEEWEKVIVHRDIKASNVLLDDQMNGRLGDFGLARLYDHGVDPQTTHVVGTLGYLAPELSRTGKATPATDVYAFGVFMLEVTCGRRPIKQSSEDDQVMLVDWVLEHWQKGLLTDTVDSKLKGDYDTDEACLALKLGLLCSHPFRNSRPSMRQVLEYLNGDKPLPEFSPTNMSFYVMSMMQNEGFDDYIISSTVTS